MEFKIGDRVKYTGTFTDRLIGKVGTVIRNENENNISVKWDNCDDLVTPCGVFPENITKIEQSKVHAVSRIAKPGEWVKIVKVDRGDTKGYYKVGDILQIIENEKRKYNDMPYYRDEDGCYLYHEEYIVLEGYQPKQEKKAEPTPEPKTVDNNLNLKVGDRVVSALFGEGTVLDTKWNHSFPILVQFDKKCKQSFKNNGYYADWVRKDSDFNIKLLKTSKRQYTAEQIAEAKRIVMEKMYEATAKGQFIIFVGSIDDIVINAYLFTVTCSSNAIKMRDEIKARKTKSAKAICSDNDTPNDDIGKMVAICKLTNTKMPKWVHGA